MMEDYVCGDKVVFNNKYDTYIKERTATVNPNIIDLLHSMSDNSGPGVFISLFVPGKEADMIWPHEGIIGTYIKREDYRHFGFLAKVNINNGIYLCDSNLFERL